MIKKLLFPLILATLLLSGCGEIIIDSQKVNDYGKPISKEDLQDGIYIRTANNEYYQANTIGQNYEDTTYAARADRLCWYTGDKFIPTLYADDQLVYITQESIPSTFLVEEFKDLGYTIGANALEYSNELNGVSAQLEKGLLESDYYKVLSEKVNDEDNLLYVEINNTPITLDNITYAGTFAGLEEGKKYKISLYKGTYYTEVDVVADTRVFASYSTSETLGYTRTKENYVVIELSPNIEQGYYTVDNSGMFYLSHEKRSKGGE